MLLDVCIIVTCKNNLPALELRRCTTNSEVIKQIVSCALHNQPITLMPKFTDTVGSLNSLVEKGILVYNNFNNEYYFTF